MASVSATQNDQATSAYEGASRPQVLFPKDAEYQQRIESYWSNTAKQRPASIVRPASSEELAEALVALVKGGKPFSVRSGGHCPSPGANNLEGGVVIDLGLFNQVVLDNDKPGTVQVGTACTWSGVYGELQKHNLGAAGGRAGTVGVGGLTLGGGNTWFTAQKGWACDNMLEAEVVLADGQIVRASRSEHADLFRALKGGSNNFGIVTRFTLATIPLEKVWGGVLVLPKETIPSVCRLTTEFTTKIPENPDNNLIIVIGYIPDMKDVVASAAVVNTKAVSNDPIFDDWKKLPAIADSTKNTSIYELSFEVTLPENYYSSWFTLTFKNDERIMAKASELHDRLVASLQGFVPEGDFMSQCIFQPLPTTFAQHSVMQGGNVLGLEDNETDGILFQTIVMMKTEEQHKFAYPLLKAGVQELKEFAASIDGGLFRWLYMNYADKSQDVIASYGEKNIKLMKEVASKYDPDGVFQRLCPGGWKLPRAVHEAES
ncbi:putative 6-Hydroxy-D-Nicotine Oxidase [Rosellinia necatrix]|uniref:Putative 6-Hydroxy-D-Nicotine Oxidase n=1 Tax=Rosellinia necatrix TaxID=77044 RepID=A0A1W2TPD0_ROSNE|nr:putative 6-Hydroxy-D-Nicotine Oxidase [Rosellinia necatrix]